MSSSSSSSSSSNGAGAGASDTPVVWRPGSCAGEGLAAAGATVPTFQCEQKPGQRNPQPSPGASDRVFYETLYEENPDSLMALKFVVYNGCLPAEDAPAALAKLERLLAEAKDATTQKRKAQVGGGSSSSSSSHKHKKKHKKKKRKSNLDYGDVAVDAGLAVTTAEGLGTVTMG